MRKFIKSNAMFIMFGLMFAVATRVEAQQGMSMFSDRKAKTIGDIVTILVMEYSVASSEAKTETSKNNDHGLYATGGMKVAAFSPYFGARGNVKNKFKGDASVERRGKLRTKITATITEISPNGNLVLQGSRNMIVNGENEEAIITGSVRPEDISASNTVYSFQIAEARITYKGTGVVRNGQKPGFIAKVFNWIF